MLFSSKYLQHHIPQGNRKQKIQHLEAENSTFEESSNYLIDDQTRECIDEMKKMF